MVSKIDRSYSRNVAIDLLYQLAEIVEKMPAVGIGIVRDDTYPICIYDKARPSKAYQLKVSTFLSLNVAMAVGSGGTAVDLKKTIGKRTSKPPWDMEPLETDAIEQTLEALGLTKSRVAGRDL